MIAKTATPIHPVLANRRSPRSFDAAIATESFGLPKNITPIVIIAIGTQGSPDQLEGILLERENAPRERKELAEIVLAGLPN
jgi:hypothetical protein